MIIVTGARGQVGSRIEAALEDRGLLTVPVARAAGRTPGGRPFHVADLGQPETLRPILAGAGTIFLYPGFGPDLVAEIEAAGVRRIVLLSSSWVDVNPRTAIAEKHRTAENLLLESGFEPTILRPDTFMTNDHFWLPSVRSGAVRTAFPEALTAPIACADIAAVAVAALTGEAFAHERLLLTGDEALTQRERIALISARLGTTVDVDVIGEEEMRAQFGAIMPPAVAGDMIDGMTMSLTQPLAAAGGFTRAMGMPAISYRDWLEGDECRFAVEDREPALTRRRG